MAILFFYDDMPNVLLEAAMPRGPAIGSRVVVGFVKVPQHRLAF
ncbi:hypothetical protein FHS56_001816 [Thermonema lapsum]|uniref:Uncharacterized protein n=1 Tax=Thermonema lapsum TaxID=28195 RepID=A0A846MRX1_9BACT|nr:hypothetical protein [Thermonema lapsum]NIK74303.1 hypothetical protein [Thermonema lapsum]